MGEITRVSNAVSVNGGVAKYNVDITIPADDSMHVGMDGSATVAISSKEDIILTNRRSGELSYMTDMWRR